MQKICGQVCNEKQVVVVVVVVWKAVEEVEEDYDDGGGADRASHQLFGVDWRCLKNWFSKIILRLNWNVVDECENILLPLLPPVEINWKCDCRVVETRSRINKSAVITRRKSCKSSQSFQFQEKNVFRYCVNANLAVIFSFK